MLVEYFLMPPPLILKGVEAAEPCGGIVHSCRSKQLPIPGSRTGIGRVAPKFLEVGHEEGFAVPCNPAGDAMLRALIVVLGRPFEL
jgi:hypothetical protein